MGNIIINNRTRIYEINIFINLIYYNFNPFQFNQLELFEIFTFINNLMVPL